MASLTCSMWDLVTQLGIEPRLLYWEHRVLATGPPGKVPVVAIFEARSGAIFRSNGQRKKKSIFLWLIFCEHNATCFIAYDTQHSLSSNTVKYNVRKWLFSLFCFFYFSTVFLNLVKIILLVRAIILWVRHFSQIFSFPGNKWTALP